MPRKTKIGIEVANVTHDSDTTFKVKRSKVKVTGRFAHCRVGASGRCSGGRGNVLAVHGKLLLRCRLLGDARHFGAHGEVRGGGISWQPPDYSLLSLFYDWR